MPAPLFGSTGPLVIGFGGNALLPGGQGPEAAQRNAAEFAAAVMSVKPSDAGVVLVHGNGPQVGTALLRAEVAAAEVPPAPLDELVAETQGSIGYLLTRTLSTALSAAGADVPVSAIVTQVVVDPSHPAMEEPTKPVGPFYDHDTGTTLAAKRGWDMVEVTDRGSRRVVASPPPEDIVEIGAIAASVASGSIVIAGGGGGIPVARSASGRLTGVEAVIDKDRTASLIARKLGARGLLILTAVGHASTAFGTPVEAAITQMGAARARELLDAGQFPSGSMGPKVEACADFASATGRPALITSVEALPDALTGRDGTRIEP